MTISIYLIPFSNLLACSCNEMSFLYGFLKRKYCPIMGQHFPDTSYTSRLFFKNSSILSAACLSTLWRASL